MSAGRQQPQQYFGGELRRKRLMMLGMPEVAAPLLDLSSYPSSYSSSSSFSGAISTSEGRNENSAIVPQHKSGGWRTFKTSFSIFAAAGTILRSFFPSIGSLLIPTCQWLRVPPAIVPASAGPARRKVTGTLFGTKRGRVCFAVQDHPRAEPVLLLDLAIPTAHLVKEMASGMVRILLECERSSAAVAGTAKNKLLRQRPLWEEPRWTVYCNGHKRGYAVSRQCTEYDFSVLSAVQTVSVGAGVLPAVSFDLPLLPSQQPLERTESLKSERRLVSGGGGAEVMYMRAKFERVVGGRDSEAFYMISPDSGRGRNYENAGPEMSIFLIRA